MEVCTTLNSRIRLQADKCKLSNGLLNIEQQIQSTDPVLWDTICILTQSTTGCRCAHCENTEHIAQQEEDDVVRIERYNTL